MDQICECGHSWWEHHWNAEYNAADGCMNCLCMMYSQVGTSSYWIVKLFYDMMYPERNTTTPCIESWIGDEVRDERKRTKST